MLAVVFGVNVLWALNVGHCKGGGGEGSTNVHAYLNIILKLTFYKPRDI